MRRVTEWEAGRDPLCCKLRGELVRVLVSELVATPARDSPFQ